MKKSSDLRTLRRALSDVEQKLELHPQNISFIFAWLETHISYLMLGKDDRKAPAISYLNALSDDKMQTQKINHEVLHFSVLADDLSLFTRAWKLYAKEETNGVIFKRMIQKLTSLITKHESLRHGDAMLNLMTQSSFNAPEQEVVETSSANESPLTLALATLSSAIESNDLIAAYESFEALTAIDQKQHKVAAALVKKLVEAQVYEQALVAINYALVTKPKARSYLVLKAVILKALDEAKWLAFVTAHDLMPKVKMTVVNKAPSDVAITNSEPVVIVKKTAPITVVKVAPNLESTKAAARLSKNELYQQKRTEFKNRLADDEIQAYRALAQTYVDPTTLAEQWKVTSAETVLILENKFAADLKQLDLSIRHDVLSHIIQIEFNLRMLYRDYIGPNEQNSKAMTQIAKVMEEEFRLIFDDALLRGSELTAPRSIKKLRIFEMFLFLQLRNFLMHGGRNLFSHTISRHARREMLRVYEAGPINYAEVESSFEEWKHIGDVYDEENFEFSAEVFNAQQNMPSASLSIFDRFFDLAILKAIMTDEARRKQKLFGVLILFLYLANERSVFLNLASNIERKIATHYQLNPFGSRSHFYHALGLNENWVMNILKLI